MKKAPIGVVILALIGGAGWFLASGRRHDETLTLYGNVDLREVDLAFRQTGRIAEVMAEEGDAVEAGALIASLDAQPLREALAAAEARVQVVRANLDRLERGARPQEIEQARAAVLEAEARLLAAKSGLARKEHLLGAGATSEREVETAREQHDTAEARLAAAREALALAVDGFRDEDIAAGRAELGLAEAQRAQAQTALDDAQLLAPSAGVLLTRAREPGAMVRAGEPIATLSLREPVVVRCYVSEPYLGEVPPGTLVEIATDSSERLYRGRVGFVSPRAEFTPKTVETPDLRTDLVYRLRIVVEDGDEHLLQGMPVTVRLASAATAKSAHAKSAQTRSERQRS